MYSDLQECLKVVITGGVGVGKTTLINRIYETNKYYNIIRIPEYIVGHKLGMRYLSDYLNKKISAYSFQHFILQYFDEFIPKIFNEKYEASKKNVLLFERVPDDTITCFVNNQYKNNLLTHDEFYKLFSYSIEINKKYNLPTYFDYLNNFILLKSDDVAYNTDIVLNRFNDLSNLLVGLYNTPKICYNRMLQRGREAEKDNYTIQDIESFNNSYNKLYEMFMNGKRLKLSTIGML